MATEKSSSKHLLNNLDTAVRDNLIGLALANPSVQITEQVDAIVRKDVVDFRKGGRVLVISGGKVEADLCMGTHFNLNHRWCRA